MAVRSFRNTSATTPASYRPVYVPVPSADAIEHPVSEESRREEAWRLRAHVAVILCLSLAMGLFGLAAG